MNTYVLKKIIKARKLLIQINNARSDGYYDYAIVLTSQAEMEINLMKEGLFNLKIAAALKEE